jgi:hypothetical protein
MDGFKFPRAIVPGDRMADALALERAVDLQARVFRSKGYSRRKANDAARAYYADDIKRFQDSLPFVKRMKAGVDKLKAPQPDKAPEPIPTAYI